MKDIKFSKILKNVFFLLVAIFIFTIGKSHAVLPERVRVSNTHVRYTWSYQPIFFTAHDVDNTNNKYVAYCFNKTKKVPYYSDTIMQKVEYPLNIKNKASNVLAYGYRNRVCIGLF